MTQTGFIGLILIVINVLVSYKGFTNQQFFDEYKFEVDKIRAGKDYKRLITSSFLHTGWMHLVFNMLSLYIFSGPVMAVLGTWGFLIVYFASMIGGDLLALLIHRNHGDYSAVGASGAVCGIIFASIAIFPGMSIGIFLLPIQVPAWLYSSLYVGFTIYAIRSKKDNIGHEAHLGGALVGMLVAVIMQPSALTENYLTILLIALPTIAFIFIIVKRPQALLVDNLFAKEHTQNYTIDQRYNYERNNKQQELDRILDKINRSGMNSLSAKEKEILKKNS